MGNARVTFLIHEKDDRDIFKVDTKIMPTDPWV